MVFNFLSANKMSTIRSLTFEKQAVAPSGGIYEITRSIPAGVYILNAARVDLLLATPNDYSSIPKSVSLEIGTVLQSDVVVDNTPSSNLFKVILDMSIVQINGDYYLSSVTYPNTSFTVTSELANRCVFKIRDQSGNELTPDYFCFHFSVVNSS